MFRSRVSAFILAVCTAIVSLMISGSPGIAKDTTTGCSAALRAVADDVHHGRLKPYVIKPTEVALLRAERAFTSSNDPLLLDVANAQKDFEESPSGKDLSHRINAAIGPCNERKKIELFVLANDLIVQRFGQLGAGDVSEPRLYLASAIFDVLVTIVFHDRFSAAQRENYSAVYSLLLTHLADLDADALPRVQPNAHIQTLKQGWRMLLIRIGRWLHNSRASPGLSQSKSNSVQMAGSLARQPSNPHPASCSTRQPLKLLNSIDLMAQFETVSR